MDAERAKRLRLRHIAYQIGTRAASGGWPPLSDEIIARVSRKGAAAARLRHRAQHPHRWFLIEELPLARSGAQTWSSSGLVACLGVLAIGAGSALLGMGWAVMTTRCGGGLFPDATGYLPASGMLSDELLAAGGVSRIGIYKGWSNVPDFYKPKSLVLEKQSRMTRCRLIASWAVRGTAIVPRAFV